MKWVPQYNTGIDVIDDQHKRILDYINEIVEISDGTDRARVKQILDNIIDYTQSRLAFLKNHSKKKRVINTAYHINVCMIYSLKKLSLIAIVLKWDNPLKANCMKSYQNG